MQHENAAYLEDILIAVDDALQLSDGMDEEEYLANKTMRLAVERVLITAGEALSQLSNHSPAVAEQVPERQKIISFRNILVHGYRSLDHRLVYSIIRDRLPSLRVSIAALIDRLDGA